MGQFPGRPKTTKGALLVYALQVPVPTQIIAFPLNPDTLTRRFDLGQSAGAALPAGTNAPTTEGTSPIESLTLTLLLDASDQLEQPTSNPVTVVSGLLPVISAIEQLIYPSQVLLKLTDGLAKLGVATIEAAVRPWTVLVWGAGRVLPVKVSGVTVTESMFDARLNPISARAELQLTTLSSADLKDAPKALQGLPTVHAIQREVLAGINTTQSAVGLTAVPPF